MIAWRRGHHRQETSKHFSFCTERILIQVNLVGERKLLRIEQLTCLRPSLINLNEEIRGAIFSKAF